MSLFDMFGIKNVQFRRKLEKCHKNLFYLAYSWCNNRDIAQDITQEAMEKALRNRKQLVDPSAIKSWLATILSNCWKDYLRRQKRFEDFDSLEFIDDTTPEQTMAREEVCKKVRKNIEDLPNKQRMVITLIDIFELRYTEVAEILQIPVGTVMSRLSRARDNLRKTLIEYEGNIDHSIDHTVTSIWRNK